MQALAGIARQCGTGVRARFQHLRVMAYLAAELDLELQAAQVKYFPAQSSMHSLVGECKVL